MKIKTKQKTFKQIKKSASTWPPNWPWVTKKQIKMSFKSVNYILRLNPESLTFSKLETERTFEDYLAREKLTIAFQLEYKAKIRWTKPLKDANFLSIYVYVYKCMFVWICLHASGGRCAKTEPSSYGLCETKKWCGSCILTTKSVTLTNYYDRLVPDNLVTTIRSVCIIFKYSGTHFNIVGPILILWLKSDEKSSIIRLPGVLYL